MLHLAGLFTHLFDVVEHDGDRLESTDSARAPETLSDFERRAVGEPLFSHDGDRAEREEPRFASMIMPPYI